MKFLIQVVISTFLFFGIPVFAQSPLAPVKVDHPRDTMESFLSAMKDYKNGLVSSDEKLKSRIYDAARTFNLEHVPAILQKEKGVKSAILLKEILDRVIIVDLSKVPTDSTLPRWRLKDTEITIKPVADGDRKGEYLFSKQTVERLEEFYDKVKHLPYLKGSDGGAGYRQSIEERVLPQWAKETFWGIYRWQWVGLFLAILIGLILKKLTRWIIAIFQKLTSGKEDSKRHRLFLAMEEPVGLAAATVFWFAAAFALKFDGSVLSSLMFVIQLILSFAIIQAAYRITDIMADILHEMAAKTETELDDQLIPMITRSLKIFVVVIGVLVAIQNLGFNVMSLLAGLGLGGLAFALAAKDTAANLFGSLMILFDRPFKPGDWIITPSAEGTVEEVGFRSTRIRTFYNSVIYIPNSTLANASIDNMGVRQYRRVKAIFSITYDTPPQKLEAFVEGLKEIIKANKYTRKDYYHVAFNSYGPSSLNILFYCFLQVPDWAVELVEKQNLFLEVLRLAEKLEISFAFPTQSLHLESTPDKPQTEKRVWSAQELKEKAHEFKPGGASAQPEGLGIFTPSYKE